MNNKYKFLILSNQPFDFELKTNKWHIANGLSNMGYDVVFVDPPLRFKALKNFLKKPSLNLGNLFFGTEKKRPNLIVYRPGNIFNFLPFSFVNTAMHARNINKLLNSFEDKSGKTILWIYHFDFPDLDNFMKEISYDVSIYDCVDEYTAFPEYAERKKVTPSAISWIQWIDDELKIRLNQNSLAGVDWVLHREKWLADNTDLMFASAPGLVLKFKNWREDVHYLPNAAIVEKFDQPQNSFVEPSDLKDIPHPRIGFTGAIDAYKNNIKLIEKSAQTYPEYHFVLIGPEKVSDPDLDLSVLKSLPNVHFLGMKKWEDTPSYFAYFDEFFIPYNLNDYTIKGCFPIKYFEALAAGLPTIVTNMPAYEGFDPDGYVSITDEEFVSNIKKGLDENSDQRIKKRKILASHNTWNGKVQKQLKLISDKLREKGLE